jgi:AcrR family transcriptional regulator
MAKKSKRTFLIDVANNIIKRYGAEKLTIDELAREASLSKGGVLYHFPTKEALLKALLENWINEFEASINKALENAPSGKGAWIHAFIKASANEEQMSQNNALALLAVIAHDHELLGLVRERTEVWQKQMIDDFDPALATLLRLAADGLFWAELLNLAPPKGHLRSRVLDLMLSLTDGQDS